MSSQGVAVVGSYNRDMILFVARFPEAGETIHALGSASSHGGKGSNQAVQAARLGAKVSMIACVGHDENGDDAVRLWESEGIVVESISRDAETPTGSATILIDEKGKNVIIVQGGANAKLSPSRIDESADVIVGARVVVTQFETAAESAYVAFGHAHRGGGLTILNAAPASKIIDPGLLALTDFLIVNEGEACALAGDGRSPLMAARTLVSQVRMGVILTARAKGAVLFQRSQEEISVPAPEIVPRDTTGAGDALVGALATMLAADWPIQDALELAVKAGSYACISLGAVSSFGNYSQVTREK